MPKYLRRRFESGFTEIVPVRALDCGIIPGIVIELIGKRQRAETAAFSDDDTREDIFMSKIVVLTGSPRRDGNSFAMTEAFIKAAENNEHTVSRFDTAFMNIGFCHACGMCCKTGKACAFESDFNGAMADAILEADVIVFSAPLYWYSIPAQLKCAIDKLYSLAAGGKDLSGKKCAVITCCEEDDPAVLEGFRIPIERTAELLKWTMIGEVLVPGVNVPGDVKKTDGCERAAALAEKI